MTCSCVVEIKGNGERVFQHEPNCEVGIALAQARQQAIADLIPQLEKKRQDSLARADKWEDAKEGDKAHYWLGVAYGQGSAIYLLNALTPPPALTKEK